MAFLCPYSPALRPLPSVLSSLAATKHLTDTLLQHTLLYNRRSVEKTEKSGKVTKAVSSCLEAVFPSSVSRLLSSDRILWRLTSVLSSTHRLRRPTRRSKPDGCVVSHHLHIRCSCSFHVAVTGSWGVFSQPPPPLDRPSLCKKKGRAITFAYPFLQKAELPSTCCLCFFQKLAHTMYTCNRYFTLASIPY